MKVYGCALLILCLGACCYPNAVLRDLRWGSQRDDRGAFLWVTCGSDPGLTKLVRQYGDRVQLMLGDVSPEIVVAWRGWLRGHEEGLPEERLTFWFRVDGMSDRGTPWLPPRESHPLSLIVQSAYWFDVVTGTSVPEELLREALAPVMPWP